MAKYIDAEAEIKRLLEEKEYWMARGHGDGGINMIIADLERAPYVDVAPVVHGKWNKFEHKGRSFVFCSKCNNLVENKGFTSRETIFKYCPECGARMDVL